MKLDQHVEGVDLLRASHVRNGNLFCFFFHRENMANIKLDMQTSYGDMLILCK